MPPAPIADTDVGASNFACLSCFGLRISRLPFFLAIPYLLAGVHGTAPAKGSRRFVRNDEAEGFPGLADPARAARTNGLFWAASGTVISCLGTCSRSHNGDGKSRSPRCEVVTCSFASKGRMPAGSIEVFGRKPHLQSMFNPGRHKKYLLVSTSLLTRP